MFTSNIGRMRFFFYSLGVAFLEAMAALVLVDHALRHKAQCE